jgi:outer membrane receptor protein involved in Fe transport
MPDFKRLVSIGRKCSAVLLVLAVATRLGQVAAQELRGPVALQEIVVTAEKRESTAQSTPISLTAISGQDIADRGVPDFDTLAQSVPGVSLRSSGAGLTEFEMRGVASTGGDSPTVGFYFDDTPLTAPANANEGKVVIDPNLYDLSRVEVLRGPQGTLYGAGSMGGTIKVVPNAPDPAALDVSGEAILSDTDGGGFNHGENAMVNLPFANGKAALRLVGSYSHRSGWLDRIVIAPGAFPPNNGDVRGDVLAAPIATDYKDVNDQRLESVRASLLWNLFDRIKITPSFFYQGIEAGGLPYIDSVPGTNAHYQPFDSPEPYADRFRLGSLKMEYVGDSIDLSSITSYWTRSEPVRQDEAESWQTAVDLPSVYPAEGGIGPQVGLEDLESKQTSEEVRLTSLGKTAFQWLVGYFYEDVRSDWNVSLPAPEAAPLFGTANLFTQVSPTKIIQQALFGQVSYDVTSRLRATAGIRRYRYGETVNTTVSGAVGPTGSDAAAEYLASESNQGINPQLTLSYKAGRRTLLYATAAKGFRPGGGTGPVPVTGSPLAAACEANLQAIHDTSQFVPSPVAFGPDSLWSYELGEKTSALDRRLTVNGSAYFENWRGVQQFVPLPCGYNFQANAGDAHIYGADLEIHAILMPGLVLSANAAYTHARIAAATLQNVGIEPGAPLQSVPDWTASAALTYERSLSGNLALRARIDNAYVGSRTDATYAINTLHSYDLTNIRVGLEGNRWSAMLFANNLLNKRVLLDNISLYAINLPTFNRVAVSQPLTVGVDLTYQVGR